MAEKDPAAVSLGRRGGQARAAAQTPEQRHNLARKAAAARWARSLTPSQIDALLRGLRAAKR